MRIVCNIIEIVWRDLAVCSRDDALHDFFFRYALFVPVIRDRGRTDFNQIGELCIRNFILGKIFVQGHDTKFNIMLNTVNGKINTLSLYADKQNVECSDMKNRIKEIRKELDLTQGQLAEMVGCSTQQIQLLESEKRGLDVKWMVSITNALNKHVGESRFKVWHLITDDEVGDLTDEERKIVSSRRGLDETQQKAYDAMSLAMLKSLQDIKKN